MAMHVENETGAIRHPLDPLTAGEVAETTRILGASGRITPRVRIMAYSLLEPAKDVVLGYQPGQPVPREHLFTPSNFTSAARLFATSEGPLYHFYGGFSRTERRKR